MSRPGGRVQPGHTFSLRCLNGGGWLSRPGGRVQPSLPSSPTPAMILGGWLSRPGGRVQPGCNLIARVGVGRGSDVPTRRPGATGCNQIAQQRDFAAHGLGVAMSRPGGRVQPGCNICTKVARLWWLVSRPGGRVQQGKRRRRFRLMPVPTRRPGATRVQHCREQCRHPAHHSPDPEAGCNPGATQCAMQMQQATIGPDPEAGCNPGATIAWQIRHVEFDPDPEAGCNPGATGVCVQLLHPLLSPTRRPGATRVQRPQRLLKLYKLERSPTRRPGATAITKPATVAGARKLYKLERSPTRRPGATRVQPPPPRRTMPKTKSPTRRPGATRVQPARDRQA